MSENLLNKIHEHFSHCIDEGLTMGEQEAKFLHVLYQQVEQQSNAVYGLSETLRQEQGYNAKLESENEELASALRGARLEIEILLNKNNIKYAKEKFEEAKRYREAWQKAKKEARNYGAGKADENITDDGKEEAYREGAEDMYEDFVHEYEKALEGEE